MRRITGILIRLAAALLVLSGASSCTLAKIKDLNLGSVGVKYLVPSSARSLSGTLLMEVDNPSISFTITDVDGLIKCDGTPIVTVTAGELPVQRKSVQVYEIPCTVTLCEGVSILQLFRIVAQRASSLEGLTADAVLHVKLKNKMGTAITFKDLDLSQFSSE